MIKYSGAKAVPLKLSEKDNFEINTEQLKEFKKAGKVTLRKFLDNIETTDSFLNGRCNNDTILLKVQ